MEESLYVQKKDLRQSLRVRRATAAEKGREAALAVRDSFLSHFSLGQDSCIAFYVAQGDELDPSPLAKALDEQGHWLCLPVVEHKDNPLLFRAYQWGDFFRLGPMRIPEPLPTAPLAVPDVVLAPLVGFDRRGHRLGQGGGFYDRTLATLRTQKKILVVGLAYSIQEVPQIPVGPLDQSMDAIVTEEGVIIPFA